MKTSTHEPPVVSRPFGSRRLTPGQSPALAQKSGSGLSAARWVGWRALACAAVGGFTLLPGPVFGQAPGLLWRTNLGATVCATDAQTNVYANSSGTVFALSGAGVPLWTNTICPGANGPAYPKVVVTDCKRDPSGNWYFAGSLDGANDFGGRTLVGGWTNAPAGLGRVGWSPGYPSTFAASYTSGGALLWAAGSGNQSMSTTKQGQRVLPDGTGGCYVSYNVYNYGGYADYFNHAGALQWDTLAVSTPNLPLTAMALGGPTATNCWSLIFATTVVRAAQVSGSGGVAMSGVTTWLPSSAFGSSQAVVDSQDQIFVVGLSFDNYTPGTNILRKLATLANGGNELWRVGLPSAANYIAGQDQAGNVYVGGSTGILLKYDTNGGQIWSNAFSAAVVGMCASPTGQRFLSFSDGSIGRLQDDAPLQAPTITNGPQSATVFVGDSVTLSGSATGTAPLSYAWQFNGTTISGANGTMLALSSLTAAQSGHYALVVTNQAGAATSSPANLRVKSVELYAGTQLLTNGTYAFTSPPTVTVRSAFPNGASFYTLDGSTPSFNSISYTAPFPVSQGAVVNAIGYSADWTESELADPATLVLLVQHRLTAGSPGGGYVNVAPPLSQATSGLVGWWPGNGNPLDSTGANPATARGGLGYAQGQAGEAFAFNGVDADVLVPPSQTLNVGQGNGLTMSLWFQPSSLGTGYSLMESYDPSLPEYVPNGIRFWANEPAPAGSGPGSLFVQLLYYGPNTNQFSSFCTPAGLFGTNAFCHAVFSCDNASGEASLYVNGVLAAQTNLAPVSFSYDTAPPCGLLIGNTSAYFMPDAGGLPTGVASRFAGLMDNVCLYSRALSAAEVLALYQSQGSVVTNSPNGSYNATNTVTIQAVPWPGWSFLYWLGDAAGTNPVTSVAMSADRTVQAVFGTTLSTSVAGSGQIVLSPASGLYPYGTTVRLTGLPQAGSYFGFWGNAARGNVNPLYFDVTNSAQTVSAIFGSVPAGDGSLTVLVNGSGTVTANPQQNLFSLGSGVTLTARPQPGASFQGWTGDASGAQNPLNLAMTQNRVVTANFTSGAAVSFGPVGGMTPGGFRFIINSPTQTIWKVLGSSNLTNWSTLGDITNSTGQVEFTDPGAGGAKLRFYQVVPGP